MTTHAAQSAFLASEIPDIPPDECLFHVIPAPFEKSVSYGSGTAGGPRAILNASYQLEAFDGVSCPCNHGIHTYPEQHTLDDIEKTIAHVLSLKRLPVLLGGEHTVSVAAFKALAATEEPIGIIQFDAHADLRDTYEGSPLSHACVMRRALEMDIPFIQLGVRALSLEEVEIRKQHNIRCYDGSEIAIHGTPKNWIPSDFPQQVYISFDIDALDSSIMPATGTPEPGGLSWWDTMQLLEDVTKQRHVIGFDVVELAPIPDLHAYDFTAARLTYNLMGMISRQLRSAE